MAVGDADVAFQVVGDGPLDLLWCSGVGHVDLLWSYPPWVETFERLAAIARLILFDRRGTGASDAVARDAIPTWEEWTEDVRAVLDAAGSDQAAILASLDGGPIAVLFAAMRPERVRALVLANTSARFVAADDYPIGLPQTVVDAIVDLIATSWGTPEFTRIIAADLADNPQEVRLATMLLRAAMTPRSAAAQYRYILDSVDVRPALPLIQVPTLVLHSISNPLVPVEQARYLADHISGAQLLELPMRGLVLGDAAQRPVFDEIIAFLTGERPEVEADRVLTTVLFTDIVGSTDRAATLGDRRWRTMLDAHDRTVRDQLRRFRGREINTTGDGFVASFDGPARAIRCAQAITDNVRKLGVDVRAGLHTGECELRGDDLGGLAVHIAARIAALAGPGEVLVSNTVKDLVSGSGIGFEHRGAHTLKGVPDQWNLYSVNSA